MAVPLIPIGIIGLSPGGWAANAHLPYLLSAKSKFKIVAVCNSSVESAKRAVELYKLGSETRTYGNPEDIAADKDVDLVVCTVRVDRHYATLLPSLKASKNIFVEWPLGKDLSQAQSLLELAKQHNVQSTAVGLQGRFDSSVATLQSLLKSGRIGKVLSSTLTANAGNWGPTEKDKVRYLIDRDIGGTMIAIPGSHCLDVVREVLGEFSSFHSLLSNQRPLITILSSTGDTLEENVPKSSHDELMIHGTLLSGAIFSGSIRGGPAFKDVPGLQWRIYGEKGEIRVQGLSAHIQINGTSSIEVYDFAKNDVEKVEVLPGTFDEMGVIHRNVARLYDAIATGDRSVLCDFEGAVRRHEFIEEMYKQNPDS